MTVTASNLVELFLVYSSEFARTNSRTISFGAGKLKNMGAYVLDVTKCKF